ncbi:MFS transporter [Pseudoflavonifractor phocaeensis]|uniref:MFS transporter n=1 Tax=Pseudoflavonifractor phocaeensis TaxID=1870988 RepID=UPI001F3AB3A3|nr:MFS transporter [Pseudoflavonifractor phocaeensis]MCF2595210.1 MFS transporter [Pseudoflavonifractor phocaeensis]
MKRPHYAWLVCAGGTLLLFTTIGLGVNVFSMFQPYLLEYGQLTNTQGSWIVTVRSFFILVGMMTANWMSDRLGLRRTCTCALLLLALSSFLFGAVRQFPLYCAASALVGLAYSWGGMISASLLVDRWFQDRQALALGVISAGTGLATILAPVPLSRLIRGLGLRAGFWCEAAFVLLAALLFWLLVRDCPEDKGLAPYRTGGDSGARPPLRPAPPKATALHRGLVLITAFLVGSATSLGIINFGVLYSTEGYAPDVVAQLISCMGLCLMVGKILYGQAVDSLGGRRSNYLLYLLVLTGFLLCCMAPTGSVPLDFAAMTLGGLGLPLSAVSPPVWAKDLWGDQGYARGLKWVQTIYALGILLVGPIPGILADATGSYVPAYQLFLGMLTLSLVLLAWAYEATGAGKKSSPEPRG